MCRAVQAEPLRSPIRHRHGVILSNEDIATPERQATLLVVIVEADIHRALLYTMDTINEAGRGKFLSVSEPWADTTTHAGKMIMTIFAGIAEFERDLIRERTGAGREAAKQRGVRFGLLRKLNTDQAQVATQLLAEGKAVRDIARTFNVHEVAVIALGCWVYSFQYHNH